MQNFRVLMGLKYPTNFFQSEDWTYCKNAKREYDSNHDHQGLVEPSITQLLVVLALIGFEMCLACFPSLIIMYDIYKVILKHH